MDPYGFGGDPVNGVDLYGLWKLGLDPTAPERLTELLGGPADLVLSDMAANTTGHKKTDHLRIIGLAETAAAFAREILAPGGAYLAKVFPETAATGGIIESAIQPLKAMQHALLSEAALPDCGALWLVSIPMGILAGLVLHLPVPLVYVCLKLDSPIKAFLSLLRIRSGKWIRNVTVQTSPMPPEEEAQRAAGME